MDSEVCFMRFKLILITFLLFATTAYAQDSDTQTVAFEIEISPAFALDIQTQEGGNITLGPIYPGGQRVLQSLEVNIKTNESNSYRIVQSVQDDFENESGFIFPLEKVRFLVSDGKNGGVSQVTGERSMSKDSTVIFVSNSNGDADLFTISYLVDEKEVIPAGNYRARIDIREERF